LQDNGGNNLSVSASGSFTFSTAVDSGAAYSVAVFTQPTDQSCTVTSGSGTASGNVTNVQVSCSNLPPTTYTIGGTVSGLTGTGLVLQDNSGNNLAVSASGSFIFSTAVASGAAYSVTVLTQPTGQSCTVTSGSGTASANVTNVQVSCSNLPPTTYTIGGTVSGLTGTGLVLQDNGGNNLAVSASGSFTFSTAVDNGAAYSVTVLTQPTGQSCTVTSGSGTASANVTNVQVTCSTTTYTIGGTISGLTASGLVLGDGSQTVSPVSGATSFAFSTAVASGSSYAVTVKTQPSGETCSVTNGSGTANANISNVQVTCTTTTYTIGGTVSGLTGTGLVLFNGSNGDKLAVSASGSFAFSTAEPSGSTYIVTVLTQPTGQSCTVTNGSGTMSANVTNIQVTCSTTTYTIGGTVSGLTGTGLVLQDNSGNNLAVSASGSFTFSMAVASGNTYSVTVLTQPTGQSCTVTDGSGTMSANVTNIQVTCSTTTYTIGGTVSGLTGTGLVLQDNSGNNLAVSASGSFTFSNSVASGAAYSVTVLTQPNGQSCTVTNGSGTASANVTNVQVVCSNVSYSIGGTVSGLTGTGLVLQDNGGNNLPLSANGSFTFSNSVASGAAYSVTVLTQPTGQSCTVTNGSGTASANVSNVQVTCSTTTYTIGGTVSGLTGAGLVLQDNSGNNLSVSASGSFTFSTAVASGSTYSVTVFTQPTGQSCTVTNGSGTASANVTNVQVVCSNVSYSIGGTVSGLTGTGLVLQDNGGNNLAVSASGSFTFSTAVASGAAYSVTVLTQPTGQSCTVTNGSGTASANVTNVQVACSTAYYTVGGTVSGLTGTGLVLQDNGGNNLAVSANGAFTFSNPIVSGATFNVTVLTQPTGQICTVTSGSNTSISNVSYVQVACSNVSYTIGGTVSGLTGTGLVLQNNGGNNLTLSANGSFTFSGSVASGTAYSITVLTQPTGQTCWVNNSGGTATANITNIQVACLNLYTIGGTVSGLTGTGLVLQDNGGNNNNQALSANGTFTFSGSVASGTAYSVRVLTQPTGQNCTVTNGNGTATANVTNVEVVCQSFYTIGGTVSGLIGTGLALQDNGGNNLTLSANGTFTFSGSVPSGAAYSVTVSAEPASQVCTVTNGSGTASANVTNVEVFCQSVYTIGGTVSGLAVSGFNTKWLVLQDNGGNNLPVNANGTFTFVASDNFVSGSPYSVTVLTQPTGQSCTVTSGSGTILANVTNVQVTCVGGGWTWMGGSSTVGNPYGAAGVYGTLGTASSTNVPGGRQNAVSWIDKSGNLWLFGGIGDTSQNYVYLNDLWEFDPTLGANGEWTWMGGSEGFAANGIYGTLGAPATGNIPGGRYGAVSWSDASGNLWLFGGWGYGSGGGLGLLNDLWKFDPALGTTGEWTWMGGSSTIGSKGGQSGVYGTLGVAASTNFPGSRSRAVRWTDASGNLWLFGGDGLDYTGTEGMLNDLWEFFPSTNQWAWMGGTSVRGYPGIYGTLGVAASTNVPGGRHVAVSWIDKSSNLWLFGGAGYDSTGASGFLNDLWEFNPKLGTNGEWTWMGGSSTVGSTGGYGTPGVAASTNAPGALYGAVSWSDASGNLWLFGGAGYDSTGAETELNDLWEFDPALGTTGEWIWMGGSAYGNQSGVYGTLGTVASTNIPGGRSSAASWSDASGTLWLFGGAGYDSAGTETLLNDLWVNQP
jgi:hypothetical protein